MAKKGQKRAQVRSAGIKKEACKGAAAPSSPRAPKGECGGGRRGLVNLGNTCFLNSILQCLNASAPFSDDFIALSQDGLGSLGAALCSVFRGIRGEEQSGKADGKAFSPKTLLGLLAARFPWYKGGAQQDAHELLRMLLGSIADEPTSAERKAAKADQAPRPPGEPAGLCERAVWDSFRGQLCTGTLCWGCRGVSLRLDPFLDLSLELPSASAPTGPMGISAAAAAPVSSASAPPPAAAQCAAGAAEEAADEDDGFAQHETRKQKRKQRVEDRRAAELAVAKEAARGVVDAAFERAKAQMAAVEAGRAWARRLVREALLRHLGPGAPGGAGAAEEGLELEEAPAADDFEFEVELRRDGRQKGARWGFQWSDASPAEGALVVAGVAEESILDRWNLKRRSMGQEERVVGAGDRVVAVNGEAEVGAMRKVLKAEDVVALRVARRGSAARAMASPESTEDASARAGRAGPAAAARGARADAAAAREAQRATFAESAAACERALPEDLRRVFGGSSSSTCKAPAGQGAQGLAACLQRFAAAEALEEDSFMPSYRCVHCSGAENGEKPTFASRRTWLWPPTPPLLTVQLKRFRRSGSKFEKSSEVVRLPAHLDLSEFVLSEEQHGRLLPHVPRQKEAGVRGSPPADSAVRYELYGICEHQGRSMSSGHYIAYVNGGTSLEKEEWHGVSDARVWKCSREEALKAEAYVAFYRREGVQASGAAREEHGAASCSDSADGDDACDEGGSEASAEGGSGPVHPEFTVAEVVEMKVVKKKKGFFFVELDIGKGDSASVVTGLKSVSVGAKVVFAPEGSEAAARAAEAAGQASGGAICGPEDLGWKGGAAECVLLSDRCRVGGPAPAGEDDPAVLRRTPRKKAAADGSA